MIRAVNAIGPGAASNWLVATPSIVSSVNNLSSKLAIYQKASNILIDLNGLSGQQLITIFDMQGKQAIVRQATGGEKLTITNTLKNGVYVVKVEGAEKTYVHKLIVKK